MTKVLSSFALQYVWRDLTNLKRGRDIATFRSRFTELAPLVNLTSDTAKYGSRLWDIYYTKMTAQEQHILSAVIQVARQLDRELSVRDAMSVLDEENIRNGSASVNSGAATTIASTTPAT